jgi:hypothetical protein
MGIAISLSFAKYYLIVTLWLFSRVPQMLQALLQSKDPRDLAAANALIKEMVKAVCIARVWVLLSLMV